MTDPMLGVVRSTWPHDESREHEYFSTQSAGTYLLLVNSREKLVLEGQKGEDEKIEVFDPAEISAARLRGWERSKDTEVVELRDAELLYENLFSLFQEAKQ